MGMIEDPLDIPGLPPVKAEVERVENPAQTAAELAKVKWSKVRGTHAVHCNVCLDEMLASGKQKFIRPAIAERSQHGVVVRYCYFHANEKRVMEGLKEIRQGNNGRDI